MKSSDAPDTVATPVAPARRGAPASGASPTAPAAVSTEAPRATDGRSTRWQQHRRQKRRELVDATLRAIRRHGAGVGLDEIAAQAGTSKTVIYRHFGDRAGLWAAVVSNVHAYILSNLDVPLTLTRANPITLVVDLADSYLSVVERDPEIYRFVVTVPSGDNPVGDPVGSITARIGSLVSANIRTQLRAIGYPEDRLGLADTWGHGVVGFIWSVTDAWLASGMARPREAIVNDIASLITPALQPITPGATTPASTTEFIRRTALRPAAITPDAESPPAPPG